MEEKGTAFVRSNVELLGVHFDKSLPVRLLWDFCFFTYFLLISRFRFANNRLAQSIAAPICSTANSQIPISNFYSYLSATTGSTDEALRAGMKQDSPEVATSSRITPKRTIASSEPS